MKQSGPFIEVYPFASKVRPFGKTIHGKTTNQVVIFLEEKSGDILPGLKPYFKMFYHDLCDAAMVVHTAIFHYPKMVDILGNSEEGLLSLICA